MSSAAIRISVGTRFNYDGEFAEIVEIASAARGVSVTLRVGAGQSLVRTTLQELLDSGRARPIIEGPVPASDDTDDDERVRYCNAIADTAQMNERELAEVQALVEAFERGEFRYVD